MKEKEAKKRESAMFQKNTILINENDRLKGQLEQAKEIIEKLMYTPRSCFPWYCLFNKAKQFLKEIE